MRFPDEGEREGCLTHGELWCPGEPKPQQRVRVTGDGKTYYDDPELKSWKREISLLAANHFGGPAHEGPVKLALRFWRHPPQSEAKWRKSYLNERPVARRPDIDNLAKAVLDALQDILYEDDGQIWSLHVEKRWTIDHDPGVAIKYRALHPHPETQDELEEFIEADILEEGE